MVAVSTPKIALALKYLTAGHDNDGRSSMVAMMSLAKRFPDAMEASFTPDGEFFVVGIKDLDKFSESLQTVFTPNKDGILDLWGLADSDVEEDIRLMYLGHNALLATDLQHPSSCKKGKAEPPKPFRVDEDSEKTIEISYKKAIGLNHHAKTAQMIVEYLKSDPANQDTVISVTSALIPGGAIKHTINKDTSLRVTVKEALLALVAPINSLPIKIRSEGQVQYGWIRPIYQGIPTSPIPKLKAKNLEVSSSTDAGFMFLATRLLESILASSDIVGCSVKVYGSPAWNKQQRTLIDDREVFLPPDQERLISLCYDFFGNKYVTTKEGKTFLSVSQLRSFMVENIGKRLHIYHGLDSNTDIQSQMSYYSEEIAKMNENLTQEQSVQFSQSIRNAIFNWRYTEYKEARKRGNQPNFDKTITQIKSAIRRARTLKSFRELFIDISELWGIEDSADWRHQMSHYWQEYRYLLMAEICISDRAYKEFSKKKKQEAEERKRAAGIDPELLEEPDDDYDFDESESMELPV
jgi:hypothetical protein